MPVRHYELLERHLPEDVFLSRKFEHVGFKDRPRFAVVWRYSGHIERFDTLTEIAERFQLDLEKLALK